MWGGLGGCGEEFVVICSNALTLINELKTASLTLLVVGYPICRQNNNLHRLHYQLMITAYKHRKLDSLDRQRTEANTYRRLQLE